MSLRESIERIRKRLDHLNCSLAERALPEDRKRRVSELALSRKAKRAGQKGVKLRAVNGVKKATGDKQA